MLTVFSLEQAQQWDQVVKTFSACDVFYLPQYVRPLALNGDGEPVLFLYESDNIRAINVVMKRDIAEHINMAGQIKANTYFDIVTPYGYGGWLFDGQPGLEDISALNDIYAEHCDKQGIICEFVRFHPLLQMDEYCSSIYKIIQHGPAIYIDLCNQDTIWNNLHRKKRNIIRKAMKADITTHCAFDAEIMKEFKNIYEETMVDTGAEAYYFFKDDYYQSILTNLSANAQIFYAMKDRLVVAASLVLMSGDKLSYHLSGSKRSYSAFQPNSLLLYNTALWGNEHGFKTLLLGGGVGSGEDSLLQFKKGFNVECNTIFKTGRKIFNQNIYEWLCKTRNKVQDEICESSYFPAYRR